MQVAVGFRRETRMDLFYRAVSKALFYNFFQKIKRPVETASSLTVLIISD